MAFVDGFNVYHFINNFHSWSKWLDYRKLAETQLPKIINVSAVYYFSAYATWDQNKVTRHNHYVSALKATGITPIISRFQNREKNVVVYDKNSSWIVKTVHGKIPARVIKGYVNEEKQTDVSIATHMVAFAAKNRFDTALLISGDTDFIPIIEVIQAEFPDKEIRVAVPSKSIPSPFLKLLPETHCRRIKGKHLRKSRLDDPIKAPNGKEYHKPTEWTE